MPIYTTRFAQPPYPGFAVIVHLGRGDVGISGRLNEQQGQGQILFGRLPERHEAGAELPLTPDEPSPVRIVIDSVAALDVLVGQLTVLRKGMVDGPVEGLWLAESVSDTTEALASLSSEAR